MTINEIGTDDLSKDLTQVSTDKLRKMLSVVNDDIREQEITLRETRDHAWDITQELTKRLLVDKKQD